MTSVSRSTVQALAHNEASPPVSTATTGHRGSYHEYTDDALLHDVLFFYQDKTGLSLNQFLKKENGYTKIPRSTFQRCYKECQLHQMKCDNKPIELSRVKVKEWISNKKKNTSERTKKASKSNQFLTGHEKDSLSQICQILCAMGSGVSPSELLKMINEYVHLDNDSRLCVDATPKLIRDFVKEYKEDLKLRKGDSLDPKRAFQASEDTRNKVFKKFDAYVRLLCSMGEVPWEKACDVPASVLFNMDEMGTDTTKHRDSVIGSRKLLA